MLSHVIDCADCAHCVDLSTPSEDLPKAVKKTHKAIRKVVAHWLAPAFADTVTDELLLDA